MDADRRSVRVADLTGGYDSCAAGMVLLCRLADVPADGGLRVELPGREPVAVFRVGSEYFVVDDRCTHGNGRLSEGEVEGDEVACPFHYGKFSLRSGEPTAPPCTVPIRTYRTEVRDGYLYAVVEV